MEEEKGGGGESSRPSSKFVKAGDRQMFTVDLRPGETTIVSWRKLMKDTNKVNGGPSTSAPEPPPVNAHPALESRIAPVRRPNWKDCDFCQLHIVFALLGDWVLC